MAYNGTCLGLHSDELTEDGHPRIKTGSVARPVLYSLHNNSDDFYAKYFKRFPGYYHTGDIGQIDEDGFVYVMSRTDDVINVAGHRITTGSIEEVIIKILEVVECALYFGVNDPLKGQVPVALLVIDKEIKRPPEEVRTLQPSHNIF
ncbi:putative AMP-dependent synthetase/ligase, AMP-binding enzyme domain-containing protein [Plasmopara halstedii]